MSASFLNAYSCSITSHAKASIYWLYMRHSSRRSLITCISLSVVLVLFSGIINSKATSA
jgi:hypothetical protein